MTLIPIAYTDAKTTPILDLGAPLVNVDAQGVWHVRGYAEAKAVLMADTKQSGFNAELVNRMPAHMHPPVLFQEGAEHREQRTQIAKFFTPTFTQQQHVAIMQKYAEQLVSAFEKAGRGDLNRMASTMAMAVAADVVGLTNSSRNAMQKRLNRILHTDPNSRLDSPRRIASFVWTQINLFLFYLLDVRPAIRARRRNPQSDVISHLLSKGRSGSEILAECITYGAAGMATTQEFLCVSAWQLLQRPALCAEFMNGDADTRMRVLHELLRLDPVVAHLYRRAVQDVVVNTPQGTYTIPAGARIDLHLQEINADARAVGAEPLRLEPDRSFDKSTPRSVMGFGAGAHRCVGEFIALAESDVFLSRLLRVPGLAIEREPTVTINETVKGYELRNFILTTNAVHSPQTAPLPLGTATS